MFQYNDETINCYFEMIHRKLPYLARLLIYCEKEQCCKSSQSVLGWVFSSAGTEYISQQDESCFVLLLSSEFLSL